MNLIDAYNLHVIIINIRLQEIEPPNEYIDISDTDMVFEQRQVNVVADENRNASPGVTIDCISDRMLRNRDIMYIQLIFFSIN